MNLLSLSVLLATAALTSSTVIKPPDTGAVPPNFELLILHNNDMHARFEQTSQLSGTCTTADREAGKCYGGFPRVATVVKEARRKAAAGEGPPVLYLNAGDTYTGTAWFTIYKWKIAAEFINAVRPDAVSLGNHEFDDGVNGLTPFIENLTCPVLTANIVLDKEPELAREANLKKSMIIDVDGVKIGIIGYLTPDTKVLAVQNNVEYIDEIVAIREEVKKLQKQKIRIVIAVGHSGHIKDLQIAKEVDGIDLVIGGHTNTFLWNGTSPDSEEIKGPYPAYVTQASGRSVPVVQAYAYTKYLGELLMTFNSRGEAIKITGKPKLLDNSVPQDPEVLKIIERYRSDVLNVADEVVGNTSVKLDGERCKLTECNLGNLITDAMVYRYATLYKGEHWTDAPIAIIQAGGIRSSISYMHMPANVTKGDLLIVMPFEGSLVVVSMNGSVILQMLEHSVAIRNNLEDRGELLQFSGLHVIYDLNKPPKSRVVKATARCGECKIPQYVNINETQIYKVIMPQFVANGGDGYTMFVDLPRITLYYNELQCTEFYIRHRSPVFPQVEGRLVLLNEDSVNDNASSTSISFSLNLIISLLSLGNHEFDEAVEGLVPFVKNISSPVVAANLVLDNAPELQVNNLYESVVLAKNGVKIGVIGYLTPDTRFLAPKNKVDYEDEITAIRREVHKLKKQGVEILIALGHSGFIKDVQIAKSVNDLDLVIGGHSNTFLWNGDLTEKPEKREGPYPRVVKDPSGRNVLVVQAYAYTKYMGRLHLTFNSKGEITEFDGLPILLDKSIPEDPDVLNIVNSYTKDVYRISNEVVGTSNVHLNGDCRLRECNLGNIITDILLNFTKRHYSEIYPDVNIAICQGGRIRVSIDHPGRPFTMTKGDWIDSLPFSDAMSIVTMNGTVLREALEHSVAGWRPIDSTGQFLQVSGIRVVYDLLKPAGSRIVEARAVCSGCGKPDILNIEDKYTYKLMMPSFLADGGDGFNVFVGLPQEIFPYNELYCIYEYLNNFGTISPMVSDRIRLLHEKEAISMFRKNNVKTSNLLPSKSPSIHSSLYAPYVILFVSGILSRMACIWH